MWGGAFTAENPLKKKLFDLEHEVLGANTLKKMYGDRKFVTLSSCSLLVVKTYTLEGSKIGYL